MKRRKILILVGVFTLTVGAFIHTETLKARALEPKEIVSVDVLSEGNSTETKTDDKVLRTEVIKPQLNKDVKVDNKIEVNNVKKKKEHKSINFNPNNVLEVSNISKAQLVKAINKYNKNNRLTELVDSFLEAEHKYGINAIFLVAITAQESDWGKSPRAINDNNLSGYGVYSSSSKGINANSKKGNILETARCLKEEYLSKKGEYYPKKNEKLSHPINSIYTINTSYCIGKDGQPDYDWCKSVSSIGKGLIACIK